MANEILLPNTGLAKFPCKLSKQVRLVNIGVSKSEWTGSMSFIFSFYHKLSSLGNKQRIRSWQVSHEYMHESIQYFTYNISLLQDMLSETWVNLSVSVTLTCPDTDICINGLMLNHSQSPHRLSVEAEVDQEVTYTPLYLFPPLVLHQVTSLTFGTWVGSPRLGSWEQLRAGVFPVRWVIGARCRSDGESAERHFHQDLIKGLLNIYIV